MSKQYLNMTSKSYNIKQRGVFMRNNNKLNLCIEPAINSCYSSGLWINTLGYLNNDSWLNK